MENSDAVDKAIDTIKDGRLTSEYATAKATGRIAYVVVAVGVILSFAPMLSGLGEGTQIQVWVGGILAAVGLASKVLTTLGYMKSRTDVKVADAAVTAAVAEHRNGDE